MLLYLAQIAYINLYVINDKNIQFIDPYFTENHENKGGCTHKYMKDYTINLAHILYLQISLSHNENVKNQKFYLTLRSLQSITDSTQRVPTNQIFIGPILAQPLNRSRTRVTSNKSKIFIWRKKTEMFHSFLKSSISFLILVQFSGLTRLSRAINKDVQVWMAKFFALPISSSAG